MQFYVTTPIYYVNDQPHVGHAYTTLAADILAIYHRMRREDVFFLTGTDEHGQKVEEAATKRNLSPQKHSDLMVENFKAIWHNLGITNDAFIRTTDPAHKEVVGEILARIHKEGWIERRTYTGWYCTPCERFWTGKDLSEGNCPDCKRAVEQISEDNYFFLMSRFHDQLIAYIETHPEYILPETRRNEVLGFLRSQPLMDLCISRPKKRLAWGIPLPFDEDYVTYVWFDALINYYSASIRYKDAPARGGHWWPADVHLVGKDILTTHAVYWSTMLMALRMPLPKTIFAHGWWTIEGRKMSKSLGNVVNPSEMAEKYGTDAFRFFLFREVPFGHDGDFSERALIGRINVDLANDLGNLASRTLKMAARYFDNRVPEADTSCSGVCPFTSGSGQAGQALSETLTSIAEDIPAAVERDLRRLQFQRALEEIWKLVSAANKYIDSSAPWALAKDPADRPKLAQVIYDCLESLRMLSVNLHPFLPVSMAKLRAALGGAEGLPHMDEAHKWGLLRPGAELKDMDALFPRIEAPKDSAEKPAPKEKTKKPMDQEQKPAVNPTEKPAAPAPAGDGLISIDDFMRVTLKTALVKHAERVPKSDKLIRLEVDSGEPRQIVAGIGKAYAPEDLIGKTVIVVANLKPAKLMGVASEGMLLAATGEDGKPIIISPSAPAAPGIRIK